MNIRNDPNEDLERDRVRDEAIIQYQRREEVESAWLEDEEKKARKPAIIITKTHTEIKHEAKDNTLPF